MLVWTVNLLLCGPRWEKTCLLGVYKQQRPRPVRAVWSAPLLFAYLKVHVYHVWTCCRWAFNFLASLYSWGWLVGVILCKKYPETGFPESMIRLISFFILWDKSWHLGLVTTKPVSGFPTKITQTSLLSYRH